jgi:hypothetical protein
MDNSTILKTFNDHFIEFLDDVQSVFPDNADILTAKNALLALRKANPVLIIKVWKDYIVLKYNDRIMSDDISFFIDKDYVEDVSDMGSSATIVKKINILREPVRNMGKENQEKVMKYLKNLTKLSKLYN